MGVGVKGDHPPLNLASMRRTRQWIEGWGAGRSAELGPAGLGVRELWRLTTRQTVSAARRRGQELLRRTRPPQGA